MAAISVDDKVVSNFKDKVVVLTGGANGIGAATVSRFYHSGAHVFFSDVDVKNGEAFEKSLQAESNKAGCGTCKFINVDVTDYQAQLGLFDAAYKQHGRVDHAIYSAGVAERPGWLLGENITLESVKEFPKPLMDVVDINLNGSMYFTRIALAYLKQGTTITKPTKTSPPPEKSLTLISSASGFLEFPGLSAYTASKSGMIGLMRSLRALASDEANVRVNVIAPSATDTPMVKAHVHLFYENKMPINTANGVAKYVQLMSGDTSLNGKAVYVNGEKGFDVEEGLDSTMPVWFGKENLEALNLQKRVFGEGSWINER